MIIQDQVEGQDFSSSLGFIPERIGISGEVDNSIGVFHYLITMET